MILVAIPALNEASTIGEVVSRIPRKIERMPVKVLVVDDGSVDETARRASQSGADFIIRFKRRRGLARAFQEAVLFAVESGAEILVNIDADLQYKPEEIANLIAPILRGESDLVLGDRQVKRLTHMPREKKIGNSLLSWLISKITGRSIPDSQTGFRAFSRELFENFTTLSTHTYTQDTILQAHYQGFAISSTPIAFLPRKSGRSRLVTGISSYAANAMATLLRVFIHHKPTIYFVYLGLLLGSLGTVFGLRVLIRLVETGAIAPYYGSALLAAVLLSAAVNSFVLAGLAELIKSSGMTSVSWRSISKRNLRRLRPRKARVRTFSGA